MRGILVFYSWIINFLFKNFANACSLHVNKWVESTLFGHRMSRHSVPKPTLLSCLWKCHMLFFSWWWWMIDGLLTSFLFPFLHFCPLSKKVHGCHFCFLLFNFSPYSFYFFLFVFILFIKKIFIFNLVIQL
jgi:hypothetical protein